MRYILVLASLAAIVTAAHADDAYSNFGPNNLSDSSLRSGIGANSLFYFSSDGFQFTPTISGTVTSLTAAIHNSTASGTIPFTLALYSDSGSNTVGTQLGSWAATAATATDADDSTNSVAVASASGVSLTAGTTYWLVATNPDSNKANALSWNSAVSYSGSLSDHLRYYVRNGTPSYSTGLGAFSVQVAPVPEPTTIAALGLGLVTILRRRRR